METNEGIRPSNISNPDRWSVYVLYDKAEPTKVRYVGLTGDRKKRLSAHRNPKSSDRTHRANWARSVRGAGSDIIMEVVIDGIDLDVAKTAEVLLISFHRENGGDLVNSSDGGDGVLEHSPDTRARISAAKKAYYAANPAALVAMSDRARGRRLSEDERQQISERQRGVPRDAETRRKISAAHIGMAPSAEARKKISASLSGRKQPREIVERRAAANRGKKISPEQKAILARARRLEPPRSGEFKGVYPAKNGKWTARHCVDGVETHLGTFQTAEAAADAYDRAASAAWGDDCWLNLKPRETAPREVTRLPPTPRTSSTDE